MYRIGELARVAGVSRDTLRFYEREGLLRPEGRSEGGYRLYEAEAVRRLRFIKQAQALGLTLEEIRAVLEVMHEGRPPCADVRRVLRQKVALLEQRIAELTALHDALASRLEWAEAHPDPACDGKDHCVYLDSTLA
ncbi:heavy metal-responsive transcriptional regulator [Calidithermus roseus]|uniref:HTH-type transcriptional regulator ZntR n=1 Tax=Calidithermus roseus TaxID=1644118 RepID=A0A399F2R0_9DEIN|nr:heavy metal-responsive transcriptional regulator [Calidithermus roseus]RIH89569.1 HTH-type transcriptional regulator ZntR [Calidithermus roseus]